jgi:hypothetical protein
LILPDIKAGYIWHRQLKSQKIAKTPMFQEALSKIGRNGRKLLGMGALFLAHLINRIAQPQIEHELSLAVIDYRQIIAILKLQL